MKIESHRVKNGWQSIITNKEIKIVGSIRRLKAESIKVVKKEYEIALKEPFGL